MNLAGVEVILELKSRLARMEGEVGRLMESIRAVAAEHASRAETRPGRSRSGPGGADRSADAR